MSTIARPDDSTSPRHGRRRSFLRFALAAALLLSGVLAALLWLRAADIAVTASLEAATHGPAQGLTVTAHPDPYFIYTEDGTPVAGITVTTPGGQQLPVTASSYSFTYGPHREGLQVGTFEVPVGTGLADYRVVASTPGSQDNPTIAVTTFDVASFNRLNLWGLLGFLAVNVGAAIALITLPTVGSWGVAGVRQASRPAGLPRDASTAVDV